jgi:rod shape-determining protein MreC
MAGRRNDTLLILGLIVLGVLLSRWQSATRARGQIDPISDGARTLIRPAAYGLTSLASKTQDFASALNRGSALQAENRRLRDQVAELSRMQAEADDLRAEVDELRRLGGWMHSPGHKRVAADVIGYFPQENRIQIDAGSRKGISVGLAVATSTGLVGRVESVASSTSQVLLITSPEDGARMTALVQRPSPKPPVAGIIRGTGPGMLQLELTDPTATVEVGEIVATSGFSSVIPRGIPIGRIVGVADDPAFGRRTATVYPQAPLGSIREVLVLK